ncbi:MAG: 5'-nucleotidase C-terminal domain-containing protein [Fimbriimonadia bacterium]|nr:5'-nucleotidase C-terminal domain-containing protein [Fimbriimonadia bacterium]
MRKNPLRALVALLGVISALSTLHAQTVTLPHSASTSEVGSGANALAQTIVEAIRLESGADIAWLGAAFFADTRLEKGARSADELLKAVQYPEDEVVVLSLTGDQIKKALERSVELYPGRNNAFLQLAGLSVRFKENGANKILSVRIGRNEIDPSRAYTVAVTASLARGALGYQAIWGKEQISRSTGKTVAEMVKSAVQSRLEWIDTPLWIKE